MAALASARHLDVRAPRPLWRPLQPADRRLARRSDAGRLARRGAGPQRAGSLPVFSRRRGAAQRPARDALSGARNTRRSTCLERRPELLPGAADPGRAGGRAGRDGPERVSAGRRVGRLLDRHGLLGRPGPQRGRAAERRTGARLRARGRYPAARASQRLRYPGAERQPRRADLQRRSGGPRHAGSLP